LEAAAPLFDSLFLRGESLDFQLSSTANNKSQTDSKYFLQARPHPLHSVEAIHPRASVLFLQPAENPILHLTMRQNVVLVALSALTGVIAQNQDQNQGQNFTIDESLVEPGTKGMYCIFTYIALWAQLTMASRMVQRPVRLVQHALLQPRSCQRLH
jgi:hypothetical protein